MLTTVRPTPQAKQTQAAALDERLRYSPYRNGAMNEPASAPQLSQLLSELDALSDSFAYLGSYYAQKVMGIDKPRVGLLNIGAESSILLRNTGLMKSSVSVELEVRTSEESVDIEAESTMITMMPIKMSGSPESIVGMTES